MISAHEKILLGVSGGADSMCLLFLLKALSQRLSFSLEVVHVNHMLRETAKRDEDFVKQQCELLFLPFHVKHVDVSSFVKENGLSVEEAARILRYEAFDSVLKETGSDKIAVAHHSQDQAETVLFHLCRGTGLAGLTGMKPVRGNLIRPLLLLTREEIEGYLAAQKIPYVTDETNFENEYARNLLRNEVFPILEQKIVKNSALHMAKTAALLTSAQDFLEAETKKAYEVCVKQEEPDRILLCEREFAILHPYLQTELIKATIETLSKSSKDLSEVHVMDCLSLFQKQVGKQVSLPYEITAKRSYEGIYFSKNREHKEGNQADFFKQIVLLSDCENVKMYEETFFLLENGKKLKACIFPMEKGMDIPRKTCTKWFDYDKIKRPVLLRYAQKDDFFYFDDTHKKLVFDYMKDEKIPLHLRSQQEIIVSKQHMLYFPDKRMSSFFNVTDQTKLVLELCIC